MSNGNQILRWALRFLKWFCPSFLLEGIEGDLLEQFKKDAAELDEGTAQRRMLRNVVRFFRPGIILRHSIPAKVMNMGMIRTDFRIAGRNLLKNKLYTLINIGGLTVSMMVCLYIMLIVADELSYDRKFDEADQIYRVSMVHSGESTLTSAWTPPTIGYAYAESYGEVEAFATLLKYWKGFSVTSGVKEIPVSSVYVVNRGCFSVFSFHFLEGDPASALASKENMVVSASLAKKFFGSYSALGKTLSTTFGEKTITGVIEDLTFNSHLESPEILLSFVGSYDQQDFLQNWKNDANTYNYIKLRGGVNFDDIKDKFEDSGRVLAGRWLEESQSHSENRQFGKGETHLEFQPLADIHLHSHKEFEIKPNGSAQYVYMLTVVAGLLILVAIMNYTNLSSARSTRRAKEVGVRKTMGTNRFQLIRQFLTESILLSCLASGSCIILLVMLIPYFNVIAGGSIAVSSLFSGFAFLVVSGLSIIVGLLGGLYPAVVVSRLSPVSALKGTATIAHRGFSIQKLLVVSQFTASLVFIVSTFIVYLQLDRVNRADLGFDKDQVVAVEIQSMDDRQKIQILKKSFESLTGVRRVALTAQIPGGENIKTEPFMVQTEGHGYREQLIQYAFVDPEFVPVLDLSLVTGRNFNAGTADAEGSTVIVNAKLVEQMGWKSPLGKKIRLPLGKDAEVIGVMNDFHIRSLHEPIQPFILVDLPEWANILVVKLSRSDVRQTLSVLRQQYTKVVGEKPFAYTFLDNKFQRQYESDERKGQLFSVFSTITVFIACLGLFGLMGITITQRTKEIGIRKVMGASTSSLSVLLSQNYITLVLIACGLAVPIAWYIASAWLNGFSYRITLQWWMFACPGIMLITVAIMALAVQSLRVSRINPAERLRDG
jgi:putative ABC transport system permease protein